MSEAALRMADAHAAQAVSQRSLLICIVNWRTPDLVVEALRSIVAQLPSVPGCHVCIVDNASGDGSAERIAAAIEENRWNTFVTLIRSDRNDGFAAGNNIAIRAALEAGQACDYVLLLNPDTIVRPDALRLLLDFMDANPQVGIAGGRSEDPDTTAQACSFRFPSLLSEFAYYLSFGLFDRLVREHVNGAVIPEANTEVDWVSGAMMIIRPQVIDDIGLMDEGYFLYYEETDFTLRARRAGWRCWHVPGSRIVHFVGTSSGIATTRPAAQRRPSYWYESRRRYFVLNHGMAYAVAVDVMTLIGYGIRKLRGAVQRKPDLFPPHFAGDLIRYGVLGRGRRHLADRQTRI